MPNMLLRKAFEWVGSQTGEEILSPEEYCSTRDVFQARLDKTFAVLEKSEYDKTPLIIAVLGEVGNNAYDHNLGNWRDMPGIYFAVDQKQRTAIIADRGQGIRATIQRVRPDVRDDIEALRIAFTETISGRAPERRGNGLKFVAVVVKEQGWRAVCYSGTASLSIESRGHPSCGPSAHDIKGCIFYLSL